MTIERATLVLPRILAFVAIAGAPACGDDSDDIIVEETTSSTDEASSSSEETMTSGEDDLVNCDLVPEIDVCENSEGCFWSEDHALCLPECGAIEDPLDCLGQHPCYWDGQYCQSGPI